MIERLSSSVDSERLVVRLVEPRDLPGLLVVHADDEVTRFLPYETWRSMDDAEAWFVRIMGLHDLGRSRQFVMIERDGERPVGAVVLFNPDAANRRAEVGYVLGRADWGRGLAREALDALLPRAFDDLDLRRIEASVDPRNVASHRLLLALGFVHEGRLRARSVMKGEPVDSNVYGLLRGELRPRPRPA
jgi:[ribosomal protein S5]-alanine N-acetyltransferase